MNITTTALKSNTEYFYKDNKIDRSVFKDIHDRLLSSENDLSDLRSSLSYFKYINSKQIDEREKEYDLVNFLEWYLSEIESELLESINDDFIKKIYSVFCHRIKEGDLPPLDGEFLVKMHVVWGSIVDGSKPPNLDISGYVWSTNENYVDFDEVKTSEVRISDQIEFIWDELFEGQMDANMKLTKQINEIHQATESPCITIKLMNQIGMLYDQIAEGKALFEVEVEGEKGTYRGYNDQERAVLCSQIEDIICTVGTKEEYLRHMKHCLDITNSFLSIWDDIKWTFKDHIIASAIIMNKLNRLWDGVPMFSSSDPWGPVISLDHVVLPEIPSSLFPSPVAAFIDSVAEFTQTPPGLVAGISVAALSAVSQRKFGVTVRKNYSEPVNIYIAVALDPGERKSAVFDLCMKPIVEWEKQKARAMKGTIKSAISKKLTMQKKIDHKRLEASKSKSDSQFDKIQGEIEQLEKNLPVIPVIPRILADDITPEAIAALLYGQHESIGVMSDEGGVFETMAGRYASGIPNIDVFLKGHSGSSVRVDRKSHDPIHLDKPAITFGLTVQPDVIHSLDKKPGFRGRGLLARFLYILPSSRLGYRAFESKNIPYSVLAEYERMICSILDHQFNIDPKTKKIFPDELVLSNDAYQVFRKFYADVEKGLINNGIHENMTDWAGKMPGAAIRLAGLFHIAENIMCTTFGNQISAKTMANAAKLITLIAEHTKGAFSLMGEDDDIEIAKSILKWFKNGKRESFTRREVQQALKSRYKRLEIIQTGLDILKERNYLIEQKINGRRSKIYLVNPVILN